MLRKLRLDFSHLREHKFRDGFKDTLNPLCICKTEAKTFPFLFLRLMITILLVCFYMVMMTSITQRIEKR